MSGKAEIKASIRLDGEKEFSSAVSNINKNIKTMQSELALTTAKYEGQANSLEALRAKHEVLNNILEAQKSKVEAVKNGLSNAATNYEKAGTAVNELKQKLQDATAEMDELKTKFGSSSSEVADQQTKIDSLNTQLSRAESTYSRAGNKVQDWQTKLNKAETEVIQANSALNKNAAYMKEAEQATDKCAKSIDEFGNATKNISNTDMSGLFSMNTLSTALGNLGSSALQKVKDVAGDTAKAIVEVGNDFDTSMSSVEAISGATGSQLDALRDKAQEMGATTKYSAQDAADALQSMALVGWSSEQMLASIDGVMSLAAASGLELADASSIVTTNINAFGLEASEAGHLADVLATAQISSATTAADLGDAYQNCSANMNAAGQSAETTTAILEAMANQGISGSEAGTKLSAVMRDITQNMEDGAIKIGNTSVAVADADGNFRNLIDILADVEAATTGMGTAEAAAALQTTFSSRSVSAMNMVLQEGVSNIADYETALKNCDGAADSLSATMQDNLTGDIANFQSAVENVGIGIYDAIEPALRGVVQIATSILEGGNETVEVADQLLEDYLSDVEAAVDAANATLDTAKNAVSSGESEAADMEAYKNILLECTEAESLNELQKYQVQAAVAALADSIPALANAFDEETGKVNLSKEAMDELFASAENSTKLEAYRSGLENAQTALADLTVEQEKAKAAMEEAQEAYKNSDGYGETWNKEAQAVMDAEKAYREATAAVEDAQSTYNEYSATVEDLETVMGESADAAGENADAQDQMGVSVDDAAAALDEETDALTENASATVEVASAADTLTAAAESVAEAYASAKESIQSTLEGKISLSDMFDGGDDVTTETMNENLQSFIDGITNYQENLQKVKEMTDEAGNALFSDEVMAKIEEGGTEYANALEHMVSTWENQGEDGYEQLKGIADKWAEALDLSESVAEVSAANQTALESMTGELGSTDVEFDSLRQSIASAVEGASGEWAGLAEATRTALDETVNAAQEAGIEIPENLAEGISSGSVSPETAIETLNASMEGRFQGLSTIAQQMGMKIPSELQAGIESGGSAAAAAIDALASMISSQSGTLAREGESLGTSTAEGVNSGLASADASSGATALVEQFVSTIQSGGGVSEAAAAMAQLAISGAQEAISNMAQVGTDATMQFASGITGGSGNVTNASSSVALSAVSSANSYTGSFAGVGSSMMGGLASGIYAGGSSAISAAASVASQALAAAKAALDIHSPSKKFRKEVGQQISVGMAFGITDKASLASKRAKSMSNKVYKNAVSWLKNYKKSQRTSLQDEQYYWQQILKHTKKGSSAYKKAMSQLTKVNNKITTQTLKAAGLSTTDIDKLTSNFGVSKYTKSGSKKKKKSTETYYSDIYTAAKKYIDNRQVIEDWSLGKELAYWQQVKKNLKSGTQAWYDATKQINSIKEEIEEAAQDAITTRANVQDDLLSKYQVYYKMSSKAEMEYWNIARKQFKSGTDERIEADQKYFEAQQSWYDERKELDEDYAESVQDINDELEESINDLYDTYHDAVKDTKNEIMSSMSLFEAFDSEGYTGETLLYNLKTQVAGLALWEQQLEELSKKGLSGGLMEELQEMGADAAANIYSLNQMTAEQLKEYNDLWEQKNALAESQAVKQNKSLLEETNEEIAQLKKEATAELKTLASEYKASLAEINTGLSSELKKLVNQAGSIGEDTVSSLIAGIKKTADSVETYTSTTKVVTTVSSQLSAIKETGTEIGSATLQNIIDSMLDGDAITSAAKTAVESIKYAMADEIATQKASLNDIVVSANSGISALNNMSNTTVTSTVNVDNSNLLSTLNSMIASIQSMATSVQNLQMVIYPDVLAGEMQEAMSQANATATVRASRGVL